MLAGVFMQFKNGKLLYSPSDLITYMESPYASAMERLKLDNKSLNDLIDPADEMLTHLQKKGYEHEDKFEQKLKDEGREVYKIPYDNFSVMEENTIRAMNIGQEIIVQGCLSLFPFAGKADFLVKVPGTSNFGDYHYEVWDTKLSNKMKPYFAIQLCCYSEMLANIQGIMPKQIAVVLGDDSIEFLFLQNYFAYYKSVKNAFIKLHENYDSELPDPAFSREYGRWSNLAQQQLEERDHLSRVAGLSRTQIKNLEKVGIETMLQLANTELNHIPSMSNDIFKKNKAQAALQIASRGQEVPEYVVLPHEDGKCRGLAMLPPHSDSDVFFDIEGYPDENGGLEYLWGNTYFDDAGDRQFIDFWAHDMVQEKQCFIDFITWAYERWQSDPSMHIYHYANYEIAAIRKLMGRHGVCEAMVDNLLRNNVFVDLYNVVRHGIMIGTPSYSIKYVEHIYRGKRDTEVANGAESIIVYENWRENPDGLTWQTSKVLNAIRDYNIDDCNSTQELTDWLREEKRKHNIQYLMPEGEGELELPEEVTKITRMRDEILEKAALIRQTDEKKSILLETLAYSLEFHRRENKPTWWKLFDRMGLSPTELYDDMGCLASVSRTAKPVKKISTRKNATSLWEYSFDPNQPFKGTAKSFYILGEENLKASVFDYDASKGIITFKTSKELPNTIDIIPDEYVRTAPIPESIKIVVEEILGNDFVPCAITDFLTRSNPRINGHGGGVIVSDASDTSAIVEVARNLDNSYLCIQGPPGAGKTYMAKHIIGELLKQGKRVGISSNSHKAILNLMTGVAEHVEGEDYVLVKAGGDKNDPAFKSDNLKHIGSVKSLPDGHSVCFGGTAWAFSNDAAENQFDYLFVDEAGQVSVANLIGMSRSSKNIILMGDQMQLGQPIQGSHPGESGMSILEYLLEGQATIPNDLGIFLPKTYRMHPDVCEIISSQVYEGKLVSADEALKHQLNLDDGLIRHNTGVCHIAVKHDGNTQASDEEVEKIKELTDHLIGQAYWPDEDGNVREITWDNILFVAPYNYQVNKLRATLGIQAKIGSVDKFQGQEAPIVILSMCSSNAAESPRGIDFLFSKNRLNVALSRAQALAVVVGNTNLENTSVQNLKQMELINFYCEIVGNKKKT